MNMNASDTEINSPNKYIIEGVVEYSPQDNKITHRESGETISLLSSASECFLLLLKNHGKLVNKSALITIGWEQYGLHVSDNTFYQNTLTLRKALKTIGIPHEVIKTVPRKGLVIPDNIQVEILNDISVPRAVRFKEPLETTTSNASHTSDVMHSSEVAMPDDSEKIPFKAEPFIQLTNQPQSGDVIATAEHLEHLEKSSKIKDLVIMPLSSPANEAKRPPDMSAKVRPSTLFRINKLVASVVILFLVSATAAMGITTATWWFYPANPMALYTQSRQVAGCHIYTNNAVISDTTLLDRLRDAQIRCQPDDVIYAATHDFIQRFSLIHCQQKFTNWQSNTCTSYYFLEK